MDNRSGVNCQFLAPGSASARRDERTKTVCVNRRRAILDSSEPARLYLPQETVRNGRSPGSKNRPTYELRCGSLPASGHAFSIHFIQDFCYFVQFPNFAAAEPHHAEP